MRWVLPAALLLACVGCADMERTLRVERRLLDVRTTEDQGREEPQLKATVEVERREDGTPIALRGRVTMADVCRTVERRRVEETEVETREPAKSPAPRAWAGGLVGAGAIGLGVGASRLPAGTGRDALAVTAALSGAVAVGLLASAVADWSRGSETRAAPRVLEQDVVVHRRVCNPRPGTALPLRFALSLRWGKLTDSCVIGELVTNEEGRFRAALDVMAAAVGRRECVQIDGHPLSHRSLHVTLADREVELPDEARKVMLERVLR